MHLPVLCVLGSPVLACIGTQGSETSVGYCGSEPERYAVTVFVDATAERPGDGSAARPFATLTAAVERSVGAELVAGRSVRLKVRPGRYDEGVPAVSGGIDAADRSRSADAVVTATWLRVEPWTDNGVQAPVVVSGSDDWTDRRWQAVPGEAGLYRTDWDFDWCVWGGNAGSANVAATAGQRREMVFLTSATAAASCVCGRRCWNATAKRRSPTQATRRPGSASASGPTGGSPAWTRFLRAASAWRNWATPPRTRRIPPPARRRGRRTA